MGIWYASRSTISSRHVGLKSRAILHLEKMAGLTATHIRCSYWVIMRHINYLNFFVVLCKNLSLSATARELDITPSAATKRLAQMEDDLGVKLVNRTTRKLTLTAEGELYFDYATRILEDVAKLEMRISSWKDKPGGLLRVNAPLGFGRKYIAPIVSEFVRMYPDVQVQLSLSEAPIHLPDESIDIVIRLGSPPDSRVIARQIASNRRLPCASPDYLAIHGIPKTPQDLLEHNAILIRQNEEVANLWRFIKDDKVETIKVRSTMSTNDGAVAVRWALDGHGILMRAEWDIAKHLRKGDLQLILDEYSTPPGDVYAVYMQKARQSAKVSLFLDYLCEAFLTNSRTEMVW